MLLEFTDKGIYCPQAQVYIDPWQKVDKAIITHAHGDHARRGMGSYLAHHTSEAVLRLRLGMDIGLQTVEYGEVIYMNGVEVSLHPAGHIYGSAQIRLAYQGEVWVVSGDYKLEDDGLSQPFESVPCHTFITESTFGLPIYNWKPQYEIMEDINGWWRENQAQDKASVLFAYSLGKAQRILKNIDPGIGSIYVHGAVWNTNEALRQDGARLPEVHRVTKLQGKELFRGSLIVAPPSAAGSSWLKKFQPAITGVASGWMNLRGAKRRKAVDRGFVLSDHADWQGLNEAVAATGAERIYVTHGYQAVFARYLREKGLEAYEVSTLFEGETEAAADMDEIADDMTV